MGEGKLLWGYYPTTKTWVPLQVDANGKVVVDMSAISLGDLGDVRVPAPTDGFVVYRDDATSLWKCQKITGANLSQTFGASATRLRNIIATPIAGEILRISNCGGSCFAGVIDDTPAAHGGQGLDATHVPYDGDVFEDMFNGLFAYDGAAYWGQIILHNTTRGNSRKIVSVDRANNVITTSASTDDWANNDVLTTESQTNEGEFSTEYFDIDISNKVGTGVDAIYLWAGFQNNTAADNTSNNLYIHPYVAYDSGKRQWVAAKLANENNNTPLLLPVTNQKITCCAWQTGTNDNYIVLSVIGTVEFADT